MKSKNYAQKNIFGILLNQAKIRLYLSFSDWFGTRIRLYLPFSDWFGTKQNSVWFKINWKTVYTIRFQCAVTRVGNDFSVSTTMWQLDKGEPFTFLTNNTNNFFYRSVISAYQYQQFYTSINFRNIIISINILNRE